MLNSDFISMDDLQLTAFKDEKNQQSMDYFYDKYSPALYGTIYRITNSRYLSEECLLATFAKAWNEKTPIGRSGRSLFTWLLHIARQAAFEAIGQDKEKITRYHTFVIRYDQHYTPFELVYFKGLSFKDAAQLSGLTLGRLKINMRMDFQNMKDKTKKA